MNIEATQWQLVIPMSGFGERFRACGYNVPKPLIPVDGKPIIEHVINMYPGIKNVFFICNQDHLDEPHYRMREILNSICPTAHIIGIAPHKLGPVYAVSRVYDQLDEAAPTIVNYCDFSCVWDWNAFKEFAEQTGCDGAVMCYTGFHPHMLHSTSYAYVRTINKDNVLEIQEKQPFTDSPMDEFASSGAYYFRNARLMREAFEETRARNDLQLKGEYYVSLAYRPLLEKGMDIRVFEIDKFRQWGTPVDLAEYQCHMRYIDAEAKGFSAPRQKGTVLLPIAGMGSRFAKENFALPKPLIPVNGRPMVLQAWQALPHADDNCFVIRRGMPGADALGKMLRKEVPGSQIVFLDAPTDGQARTCLLGVDGVDMDAPLTIGACDNGLVYNSALFTDLMDNAEVDFIVWTMRGYPGAVRHPEMYGWVNATSKGDIIGISVKKPLSCPETDPAVTGAFTFKRASDFVRAAEHMILQDRRINGEFYVDECVNDAVKFGLKGMVLDVEAYLCWGTPDDLRTYEYWRF